LPDETETALLVVQQPTNMSDAFQTQQTFDPGNGKTGSFFSLPALEKQGVGPISRLPISIRIVLESVLRNCDGEKVTTEDVRALANWNAKAPEPVEIPFVVARVVLQDFTGVPLLVDLAADALDRGAARARSTNDRAARGRRPRRGPQRPGRFFRITAGTPTQSRSRIQTQPRALRIAEVGPAGVQDVSRRAAGHRHRAPGESRISREGRARDAAVFIFPTRSSAPIRTRQ
jgi:hypothetical protein